jgi:carboxylesterase type B
MNVMLTDAVIGSPRRWITGLMAKAGQPTFSYHFKQVGRAFSKLIQMLYGGSILTGVTHYAEVSVPPAALIQIHYAFGDPTGTKFEPNGTDEALSVVMRRAWVSFVHGHNPNHGRMPKWPDYRDKAWNMDFESGRTRAQPDVYRREGMRIWTEERIVGCSGLSA